MAHRTLVSLVALALASARCGARSELIAASPPAADGAIDAGIDSAADARVDAGADARIDSAADVSLDAGIATDADSAPDAAPLADARDDVVSSDVRADAAVGFEIRDEVFLSVDWTAENPTQPFCSTDYVRYLGGNEPRSEPVADRGDPPSAWRLRTGPIATSAQRCTHWVDGYHRSADVLPRALCHYEISFDHRVEAAGLWINGAFQSPLPTSGSALFGVAAASSARITGELRSGAAASSRAWARSQWHVTRAQLSAAGVSVGGVVRFGIRAGNSTNIDQAGLGYFVDNTIDRFVVRRFVDPNDDGDCSDATPG
jgi:hypothetical protein